MTYYSLASGVGSMWFRRKRSVTDTDRTEAQIQAVRADLFHTIDQASENTEKLNKLLAQKGDTTYLIFLATGGEKRNAKH